MAARAIWKGKLKMGSTLIPVSMYSAVVDKGVHFHILEESTKSRVKQHMVSSDTEEEVANADIARAFQTEPGTFVVLTSAELKKLEPAASRDIEITRFLPLSEISSQWYDRPYYLGPAGDANAYFAFAAALANQEKEGVARWTMRGKRYAGALKSQDGYLMLVTLRHSEEVVTAENLPSPSGRALTSQEVAMARQLVGLLEGEYDLQDFKDEYRERVIKFLESKAKGHKPRLSLVRSKPATSSLDKALSKSIAALKKRKEKAAA